MDCHVLNGFSIYMIGILGSLSDVVGGFSCTSFIHHVISSCNLLVNIKGLESTFFYLAHRVNDQGGKQQTVFVRIHCLKKNPNVCI